MKGVFNADSFLMRLLSRFADLVIINVLWISLSIPIVTFGAATTAVCDVMIRCTQGNEGSIVKSFFRAFAKNFRQSTVIWLILLVTGGVFAGDLYISLFTELLDSAGNAAVVLAGVLGVAWIMTVCWVFPLQARFDNTVKQTIKNALFVSILELPKTVISAIAAIAAVALPIFVPATLFFWLFLGYALIAFLMAKIYLPSLDKYKGTEKHTLEA